MEVRLGRRREVSAVNEALLAQAGSGKTRILCASFFSPASPMSSA